jgi:hypothetical protein
LKSESLAYMDVSHLIMSSKTPPFTLLKILEVFTFSHFYFYYEKIVFIATCLMQLKNVQYN